MPNYMSCYKVVFHGISSKLTHKKPLQNFRTANIQNETEKLVSIVKKKAHNMLKISIFLRPLVSAKNPHKW
jgi:hypothetical protein